MSDIDFSSNEYRFLKDVPYLKDNVFYLTLGGSMKVNLMYPWRFFRQTMMSMSRKYLSAAQ